MPTLSGPRIDADAFARRRYLRVDRAAVVGATAVADLATDDELLTLSRASTVSGQRTVIAQLGTRSTRRRLDPRAARRVACDTEVEVGAVALVRLDVLRARSEVISLADTAQSPPTREWRGYGAASDDASGR